VCVFIFYLFIFSFLSNEPIKNSFILCFHTTIFINKIYLCGNLVLCTPWLGSRLIIGMVVGGAFEMLHSVLCGFEVGMDESAARR
jgi:hypothetical protein